MENTNDPTSLEQLHAKLQQLHTLVSELEHLIAGAPKTLKPDTSTSASSRAKVKGKATDHLQTAPEQTHKTAIPRLNKKVKTPETDTGALHVNHEELAKEMTEFNISPIEAARKMGRDKARQDVQRMIAADKARMEDARKRKAGSQSSGETSERPRWRPVAIPHSRTRRFSTPGLAASNEAGESAAGPSNATSNAPTQTGTSAPRSRPLSEVWAEKTMLAVLRAMERGAPPAILLGDPPSSALPHLSNLPPLSPFPPMRLMEAHLRASQCGDPNCPDCGSQRHPLLVEDYLAALGLAVTSCNGVSEHRAFGELGGLPLSGLPPFQCQCPECTLSKRPHGWSPENYRAEENAMRSVRDNVRLPAELEMLVAKEIDKQVRREAEGGIPALAQGRPTTSLPFPPAGPWGGLADVPPFPGQAPWGRVLGLPPFPQVGRETDGSLPRSIPLNAGGWPVIACGPDISGPGGDAGKLWGDGNGPSREEVREYRRPMKGAWESWERVGGKSQRKFVNPFQ